MQYGLASDPANVATPPLCCMLERLQEWACAEPPPNRPGSYGAHLELLDYPCWCAGFAHRELTVCLLSTSHLDWASLGRRRQRFLTLCGIVACPTLCAPQGFLP